VMVIVEIDRASSLLHAYHVHTHKAPSKTFSARSAPAAASDMDDAWNNGREILGKYDSSKPVMERASLRVVLRPYRFYSRRYIIETRRDDGDDVLQLAKRN
jgi:hypothetical protein